MIVAPSPMTALAVTAAQPVTGTIDVLAGGALGLRVGGAGFFSAADIENLWTGTLAWPGR
jgi:hypothetical protein